MKFKKTFSILVITALLFGGATGFATVSAADSAAATAADEDKVPMSLQYSGSVAEIIKDNDIVSALVIIAENNESASRRFNVSEDTVVIDNESGIAEGLSAIKVGDKVSVIASPMSTFSIPPQSPAYVILANIQNKAPAKLMQVGTVSQKADGTMTILDTEDNYLVSLTKDTVLAPYRTKQIVLPEDIQKGVYILVWSEIMTLSIPAQMTADMVVLLAGYDFGKTPMPAQTASEDLDYTVFENSARETMLPVRSIAEGMGFEVKWSGETRTVELKKDALTYSMKIGSTTYVNNGQEQVLQSAPEINNDRTYAPAAFFTEIMGVVI